MVTESEFTSYEKIYENTNKWNVTEQDYRYWKKEKWVVTEKIHGANFCIMVSDDNILCAKRKKVLRAHENFFNHPQIINKYKDSFQQAYLKLKDLHTEITSISIYGEIFGGEYPHRDFQHMPSKPVQTGIYYSPHIEFCCFDISISTTASREYVNHDVFLNICLSCSIPYAQPLYEGDYQHAMNYSSRFESTIPKILGLPHIPNNYAEGIVIKPKNNIYVATKKGNVRPIIKKKIAEFSEAKYDQSQKWNERTTYNWTEIANSYITSNRLNNVISKIGNIDYKNAAEKDSLQDYFVLDVLEQLEDDYVAFSYLDQNEVNNLMKTIALQTEKIMEPFLRKCSVVE